MRSERVVLSPRSKQTSNITYRIYDYNRKDVNGNGRELHTELAKDAIDYTLYPDYRTHYKGHTNATVELADCKYFTTNLLDLDTIMVRNFSELDSFVVYICMAGKASIRDNKGNDIFVHQGQTVLIPAGYGGNKPSLRLRALSSWDTYIGQ